MQGKQPYDGYDGSLWCLGITDNKVYSYANQTWTLHASMGTGVSVLAVQDVNNIYSLQSYTCGLAIYKWSGTAWVLKNGCVGQFAVGADGSMVGTINGQIWCSTDAGSTWTELGTAGWTYADIADSSTVCGVNGGKLYTLQAGAMTLFSPQPSGTMVGCAVTPKFSKYPLFTAWGCMG